MELPKVNSCLRDAEPPNDPGKSQQEYCPKFPKLFYSEEATLRVPPSSEGQEGTDKLMGPKERAEHLGQQVADPCAKIYTLGTGPNIGRRRHPELFGD